MTDQNLKQDGCNIKYLIMIRKKSIMNIINLKNITSKKYFLLIFSVLLIVGCNKSQQDIVINTNYDTQLSFNLTGIEFDNNQINPKVASKGQSYSFVYQSNIEIEKKNITIDGEKYIVTSSLQNDNFTLEGNNTNSFEGAFNKNRIVAASSLEDGIKYRILLYDQSKPGDAPISLLGIAGQELKVGVNKGKTYKWVAISNNDTTDPLSDNFSGTTITSGQKDLLYATNTVTIPSVVPIPGTKPQTNVNIVLKHLLSRVRIQLDVTQMPNPVVQSASVKLSTSGNNHIHNGIFNVSTGALVSSSVANTTPNTITVPVEYNNTGIAYVDLYTARFAAINPFDITVENISVNSNGSIKTLPSAQTFRFTTLSTTQGVSSTTKIEFMPAVFSIDCVSGTSTGSFKEATYSTGSKVIRYSGALTQAYSAIRAESTGVLGLTATATAGNLAYGNGSITLNVSGTPKSSGVATFAVEIEGKTCNFSYTVSGKAESEFNAGCTTKEYGFNISTSSFSPTTITVQGGKTVNVYAITEKIYSGTVRDPYGNGFSSHTDTGVEMLRNFYRIGDSGTSTSFTKVTLVFSKPINFVGSKATWFGANASRKDSQLIEADGGGNLRMRGISGTAGLVTRSSGATLLAEGVNGLASDPRNGIAFVIEGENYYTRLTISSPNTYNDILQAFTFCDAVVQD